jgi:hypothetical protein
MGDGGGGESCSLLNKWLGWICTYCTCWLEPQLGVRLTLSCLEHLWW